LSARVAVFASGGGTNLQALLDYFNADRAAVARVELVLADKPDCGALVRAARAGVPTAVVACDRVHGSDSASGMLAALEQHDIHWIALAGFLHLVPASIVARWHERILNIHPALLPAFGGLGMYGMRVHAAVIASGARVSGATVHLVDEQYDRGRILAQWPVPVLYGDTAELLAARVLRVEHRLYPAALEAAVRGVQPQRTIGASYTWGITGAPSFADIRRVLQLDQQVPEKKQDQCQEH
jgi:phosphoribosylglycinamide formyltransferase-1